MYFCLKFNFILLPIIYDKNAISGALVLKDEGSPNKDTYKEVLERKNLPEFSI